MASVFMAALFAHLTAQGTVVPPAAPPSAQDVRCYRLMAELAEDEDPRISSAGLTGAQYFLGRIDVRSPGFEPEPDGANIAERDRAALIGQCGALMGAGGRDFRSLSRQLADRRETI
jgi:hypothetical protein